MAAPQRGSVLAIALLFLVVLVMLGTAGVRNNALEERMAGNTRNADLAFQAAEHALLAADIWIASQSATGLLAALDPNGDGIYSDDTPNDGIRPEGELHANDAAYWSAFDWTSADLRSATGSSLANVASQPSYLVERLPSYTTIDGKTRHLFRVTARGVGGDGTAVAILQTMYQFEI